MKQTKVKSLADETELKPEWQRAPWWRWLVVMKYIADPKRSIKQIEQDPWIYDGIMFARDRRFGNVVNSLLLKKYPTITNAFSLFNNNQPFGLRWWLEAALLTEASDEDIASKLPATCSPKTIKAYRKLFFDVEEYLSSDVCISSNIIGASCASAVNGSNWDFVWKRVAYAFGFEAFCTFVSAKRKETTKDILRFIRQLEEEQSVINSLHASHALRDQYASQAIEILKLAKQNYTLDESEQADIESSALEGHVREAVQYLDVMLIHSKEKCNADEPRFSLSTL